MALLGGHQRKAVGQVEAHLVAEYAVGTGAGAVALEGAVLAHVAHQVEVLFHDGLEAGAEAQVKKAARIVKAQARLVSLARRAGRTNQAEALAPSRR